MLRWYKALLLVEILEQPIRMLKNKHSVILRWKYVCSHYFDSFQGLGPMRRGGLPYLPHRTQRKEDELVLTWDLTSKYSGGSWVTEPGSGDSGFRYRRVCRHEIEASALGVVVSVSGRVSRVLAGRTFLPVVVGGAGQVFDEDVVRVSWVGLFDQVDADVAVELVVVVALYRGRDDHRATGSDGVVWACRDLVDLATWVDSPWAAQARCLHWKWKLILLWL